MSFILLMCKQCVLSLQLEAYKRNAMCVRTFTHNQGLNWVGMIQNNNLLFKRKKKMIGSLFSNPFHFICLCSSPGFVCSIMHIMDKLWFGKWKSIKVCYFKLDLCHQSVVDHRRHRQALFSGAAQDNLHSVLMKSYHKIISNVIIIH